MLHETYRPTNWQDVAGQPVAAAKLQRLACLPGGRALWITGQSGTGKSTLARLFALETCDAFCIDEFDAGELTPAAVRELERSVATRGFGQKGGRAIIVNEAHGLRRDTIRALLVALERIPPHVRWIFTTTCDGEGQLFDDCDDSTPFVSRCTPIALARRDLAQPFAERARAVCELAGLPVPSIAESIRLAKECRNNLRMMLSRLEAAALAG